MKFDQMKRQKREYDNYVIFYFDDDKTKKETLHF